MSAIEQSYALAKEKYAAIGVDTDAAIKTASQIPISMHCWQGDDVGGFENPDGQLTGGIQVTGSFPGKAKSPEELRAQIDKVMTLVPGTLKLALHAMYRETGGKKVDRDEILPEHFNNWIAWANERKIGLDFNPSLFAHPLSDPFTLSSPDEKIRNFWIKHCIISRKIGEYLGRETGKVCVNNIWIPDGYKDVPVDRLGARKRLLDSLDQIFDVSVDKKYNLDAVECKLFGIGSESCVIGSHEFYLGYAVRKNVLLTLDSGHFHPTETISDKISSVLLFVDQILLHVSRPVRWDSDHVVVFSDDLKEIALEIVRNDFLNRVHIGLDFFDGSINRIAAWTIGTRNMAKALLYALLEPTAKLKKAEQNGDYTTRLALLEEMRSYPFGAVWDYYCESCGAPASGEWVRELL